MNKGTLPLQSPYGDETSEAKNWGGTNYQGSLGAHPVKQDAV